MKTELIEYHRKRLKGVLDFINSSAERREWERDRLAYTVAFHERAVAWLESLPQSDSPSDAATAALEKASAWMKP